MCVSLGFNICRELPRCLRRTFSFILLIETEGTDSNKLIRCVYRSISISNETSFHKISKNYHLWDWVSKLLYRFKIWQVRKATVNPVKLPCGQTMLYTNLATSLNLMIRQISGVETVPSSLLVQRRNWLTRLLHENDQNFNYVIWIHPLPVAYNISWNQTSLIILFLVTPYYQSFKTNVFIIECIAWHYDDLENLPSFCHDGQRFLLLCSCDETA